jgi:hypothetical protein
MLITAACGGCAAVAMIAVDAIPFHSTAAFVAARAAGSNGPVTVITVVAIADITVASTSDLRGHIRRTFMTASLLASHPTLRTGDARESP